MASGHYTWFKDIPQMIHGHTEHYADTEKLFVSVILGLVLVFVAKKATASLRTEEGVNLRLVPGSGGFFHGFFDVFIDSFTNFHDSILGKHNRKYLPLTGSVFMFLLFANLLGLVPGMAAVTTSVWINVGIALIVFVCFNWYGIREHGVVGYLKHFWGPVWWLGPFIFTLEIASTCMRILTLNLRLYWNITADHLVLGTFTELTKVIVPCLFYGLGTFVSFMQAFVFTTLTIVYIHLAVQHEEH